MKGKERHAFAPEPFRAPPLLRSGAAQSIASLLLRPESGPPLQFERLDTPDGDFLDLAFAQARGSSWSELGEDAPIVLVLHGLEGSAAGKYMMEMYRQLAQRGLRPAGLNFRSCGAELNRTRRFYHAGATDDVALALHWLAARYPQAPIGLAGFSLGGNMLLKYVGENGRFVSAAVAVSPPFDLVAGSHVLRRPGGRLISRRFLKTLLAKVKSKADVLQEVVRVEEVLAAGDLWEFDNRLTAPLHGFRSAVDYYVHNSSGRFLADIQVPTLLIRALDDPLFSRADIPFETIRANNNLQLLLTQRGGHVGFCELPLITRPSWWAERQGAAFLAHHLCQ